MPPSPRSSSLPSTSPTARYARPWSTSTQIPAKSLPDPSTLHQTFTDQSLPPPVAARLLIALALHRHKDDNDHHNPIPLSQSHLQAIATALPSLSQWPSLIAAAVFPHSALPTTHSSIAPFASSISNLARASLSSDALSPSLATATPLQQIRLGLTAETATGSRIPRIVQYSLSPGYSSELDYLQVLTAPKKKKSTLSTHHHPPKRTILTKPARRPVTKPSARPVDPHATFLLGRNHGHASASPHSRRRAHSSLPPPSPSLQQMVQSAATTTPRKGGDAILDDHADVVQQQEQSLQTPENGHASVFSDDDDEIHRDLHQLDLTHTQHQLQQQQQQVQHVDPLALHHVPQEAAAVQIEQQPEDVLLIDDEETEAKKEDTDAKLEDTVQPIQVEDKPDVKPFEVKDTDDDDVVIEIGPNGKETRIGPLRDKKRPNMGSYLADLRALKRAENKKKQMRLIPIDAETPITELPQAPDTAFARQARLKEKKAKDRDKVDAAKQKKKALDARNQQKRKMVAQRKKKKAAELKGEVYVSSGDEEEGTADADDKKQQHIANAPHSRTEPIDVDSTAPQPTAAHHDPYAYNHQSNKRQRLNLPPTLPYRPVPPAQTNQRYHGNGSHSNWHGNREQRPPNGVGGGAYRYPNHPPYPPAGSHRRYPDERYQAAPYHHQHPPPHPSAPYPPPPGGMPYPPHPQYSQMPPGAPYSGPGYAPHGPGPGAPPNHMYGPDPQYSHAAYNHPQAPFTPHPYYAERERLPRPVFNQKRDELYKTIGSEYEDLTPQHGKEIDDFLDNQLYMFRPGEDQKDYVLQRRPGVETILRIRKQDGVWSLVRLRD